MPWLWFTLAVQVRLERQRKCSGHTDWRVSDLCNQQYPEPDGHFSIYSKGNPGCHYYSCGLAGAKDQEEQISNGSLNIEQQYRTKEFVETETAAL